MYDTNNSTAKAPAMLETPGLVTVHCWSSVLSTSDFIKIIFIIQNNEIKNILISITMVKSYISRCCDIITKIAA